MARLLLGFVACNYIAEATIASSSGRSLRRPSSGSDAAVDWPPERVPHIDLPVSPAFARMEVAARSRALALACLSYASVSTIGGTTGDAGLTNGVGTNSRFRTPGGVSITQDGSTLVIVSAHAGISCASGLGLYLAAFAGRFGKPRRPADRCEHDDCDDCCRRRHVERNHR